MVKKILPVAIPDEVIMNKIYYIRGKNVMLDQDLAELYDVETKRLNEQVKRNLSRFPDDFMFQLNNVEFKNLKSQFATSSWGGRRKIPFAFTEHGVLMLSSVLNSDRAIKVNIQIIRIFTKIRGMLMAHKDILLQLEQMQHKLFEHDTNILLIFEFIDHFTCYQKHKTSCCFQAINHAFCHKWKGIFWQNLLKLQDHRLRL